MNGDFRAIGQTIVSPAMSTMIYFSVFGSAIGDIPGSIYGENCGTFIVPELIMLTMLSQSISNASFSIYFLRCAGNIYKMLSVQLSS